MDNTQTIRWIVTSVLRLVAGYFAVKLGKDAISDATWVALGDGLVAVVIAGLSIYTSVKGRKKLLDTTPPEAKQ